MSTNINTETILQGTPAEPTNAHKQALNLTPIKRYTKFWQKSLYWLFDAFGRLFRGAIWFSFLALLVPELREQIPTFYTLVDKVMEVIEKAAQLVLPFLESLL